MHTFSFSFFSSVCYVFVLFCSVLLFFLNSGADTSLFLFHLIVENLILHVFLIIMKIIPYSGMFQNVPCSWFYRRPLKNTSAVTFHLSSTLVCAKNSFLSVFGNCFVNFAHSLFLTAAILAFVSGFRAHLSKADSLIENPEGSMLSFGWPAI